MQEAEKPPATAIDADLYSRQIGAFGLETMGKLMSLQVLICGLDGCGIETAKNLVLAGPKRVTLFDTTVCSFGDLAANFAITENDIRVQSTRAAAVAPRLAELNDYVTLDIFEGVLSEEVLARYDVVVAGNLKLSQAVTINAICHAKNIPFIAYWPYGLCAAIFCGFGDHHTIHDPDGEQPRHGIVEAITQAERAQVHLHQDNQAKRFQRGDWVRFKEVQGMTELNNAGPFLVTESDKTGFTIDLDTRYLSPYTREGLVEQVKVPYQVRFETLQVCLRRPIPAGCHGLTGTDFGKMGRAEQLHAATLAVCTWREQNGHLPTPHDAAATLACIRIAREINEQAKQDAAAADASPEGQDPLNSWRAAPLDQVDEDVVAKVANYASCVISPIAAFVGGIVAQEVVKQTGKFKPLRQWLYYDCFECLPTDHENVKDTLSTVEEDHIAPGLTPQEFRYGPQISIFGRKMQKILGSMNIFLVGAGALGCEYLKAFALMGCCTKSHGGRCVVTDMDHIEVSNLNRQFLFRRHHVGSPKSLTAAEAAVQMNSDFVVEAKETRVGPETEEEFDDTFWEGLTLVVNALDNIQSRLYIDGRCVWYHKPLLESGTLGTKANSQVIVPRLTESYGDSRDPPEDSIPLCTLRHFPNQIEHTIEWSRDAFQGLFADRPRQADAFISNPDAFIARLRTEGTVTSQAAQLREIRDLVSFSRATPTYEDCVARAVALFTKYFHHQVAELLQNFPPDHTTSSGVLFWSGPKRCPQAMTFDAADPLHVGFVHAAANLYAFMVSIEQERDVTVTALAARKIPLEPFQATNTRMKIDEKGDVALEATDNNEDIDALARELKNLVSDSNTDIIRPVEFEKDDDTNFHIDFMHSCANLRARNYSHWKSSFILVVCHRIPECPRHKTKMIAGRIIPAIATTTAMITGLVCVELLKLATWKQRTLDNFRNSFVNLASTEVFLVEPVQPPKTVDKDYDPIACGPVKARPNGFTSWDVTEHVIRKSGQSKYGCLPYAYASASCGQLGRNPMRATHHALRKANATLQDLISAIEKAQNVEVLILSVGNLCLYNSYLPAHKARMPKQVADLVQEITKAPLPHNRRYVVVEASCSDADDGTDVVIPTIKLVFK